MVRRGGWLSRGLARAVFRRGPRSPESVVACGCSGSGKQPAPAAPTSPAFEPTAGGALHAGFVPVHHVGRRHGRLFPGYRPVGGTPYTPFVTGGTFNGLVPYPG
jgi:hypothetical protein